MNATLARLTRLSIDPLAAGDGPLLEAYLAGDESAFALLVRRHAGLVFATCRRILRHQQDAEDAFQATFLVLARRAADIWPREAVAAWLFGVARRVALKARSIRDKRSARELPVQECAAREAPAAEFDLVESVHRVVAKLPEVYRAAVVACDLEGLSRKEAAERLGWSEGTLSGRLARARAILATRLRRLGLTLPPGGVAVLGATETASAEMIQSALALASGGGAGVSASVVTLTEGIVRSMALFKLKAMTAAVLTACVLGFGVLAASGGGAGGGSQPEGQPPPAPAPSRPFVPVPAKPIDPHAGLDAPALKRPTDRDLMQGKWRVVTVTEDGKTTHRDAKDPWTIEISGDSFRMPYLEGGKTLKQREYKLFFTKQEPDTFNFYAPGWPVGSARYEFTAPRSTCISCHKDVATLRPNSCTSCHVSEAARLRAADRLQGRAWGVAELCEPCRNPLLKSEYGLRLALSIDGKRPKEFGGPGVIVFDLSRITKESAERERLQQLTRELERAIRAAAGEQQKAELEAQLRIARASETLVQAQEEVKQAKAEVDVAHAQFMKAKADSELAAAKLERAQARLKQAEKAVAEARSNSPGGRGKATDAFSVHVRTLTTAEKVIRVKSTGKETVLGGLIYAADDVPIKSDGVSVWVVRDKKILRVDLPAILKGDDETNYLLKAGDQLFVQAKPK